MKTKINIILLLALFFAVNAYAESEQPYIEVTGTSEIEITPDKIHYIIEIKEYFKEEFDGKSKPEDYRTKVPIAQIEKKLLMALNDAGIPNNDIRTEEIGDYWRKEGRDFLISKKFDITLDDFKLINQIIDRVDTKGISTMYIGELENNDILLYHQQGKIEALKAAQKKAQYLAETLGKKLGDVIRIVEENNGGISPHANAMYSNSAITMDSLDRFRKIKRSYSMLVRFAIID